MANGKSLIKVKNKQQVYFSPPVQQVPDEGVREIKPLLPFVISGGENTERYYFKHLSDTTIHKFKVLPEYFGNEASYPDEFPKRIDAILKENPDAKIFCVFDFDTIYGNKANQEKHKRFENSIKNEIANGSVVLCPSMPSIEYWFLLHFENRTQLIKTCGRTMQRLLSPYMMPYFQNTDGKSFLKVLKSEECVKDSGWVVKLCENGKLDDAIQRAENNIIAAEATGDFYNQSYSFVYLLFKN